MTSRLFSLIGLMFRSVDAAVKNANALDKAYADGVGKPEQHNPFGLENPQAVAMNQAGVYAADTAANILAADANGNVSEDDYVDALERISTNKLDSREKYVVKNCANLAWRAGQPFRDIGTQPLGRITRNVNEQFNLLPVDEQDKDLVQTQAGAKILLETVSATVS